MPTATLNFLAVPAQRIGSALGEELGLVDAQGAPRSATVPEYENWLRDVTRRMVQGVEQRRAHKALDAQAPAQLDIT